MLFLETKNSITTLEKDLSVSYKSKHIQQFYSYIYSSTQMKAYVAFPVYLSVLSLI